MCAKGAVGDGPTIRAYPRGESRAGEQVQGLTHICPVRVCTLSTLNATLTPLLCTLCVCVLLLLQVTAAAKKKEAEAAKAALEEQQQSNAEENQMVREVMGFERDTPFAALSLWALVAPLTLLCPRAHPSYFLSGRRRG